MLVSTISQLNALIASFGEVRPENIVSLLEERQIIVSPEIEKLLRNKAD